MTAGAKLEWGLRGEATWVVYNAFKCLLTLTQGLRERKLSWGYEGGYRALKFYWAPKPY